jgi:hypothetical protein
MRSSPLSALFICRCALLSLVLTGCDGTAPPVATHIEFIAQPSDPVVSMEAVAPVEVAFLTDDDEVVTNAAGEIQVFLVTTDPAAHLFGTASAAAMSGIATFADLKVDRAATGYRLVAKAPGVDSTLSQPFAVTAGPASQILFESTIAAATAGSVLTAVVLDVADAGGNTITSGTPVITMNAATTGSAVLAGTVTRAAVAGRATFDDLSICRASSYTLTAAATGLTSATSNQFQVQAGAQTQLSCISQPAGAKAGVALPTFTVAATDACGNPPSLPPGGSLTVTLSLGSNPAGAVLSGTLTKSGFAIGVQFTDIVIDKPGAGYTLVATVSGPPNLTPATSAAFTISP